MPPTSHSVISVFIRKALRPKTYIYLDFKKTSKSVQAGRIVVHFMVLDLSEAILLL